MESTLKLSLLGRRKKAAEAENAVDVKKDVTADKQEMAEKGGFTLLDAEPGKTYTVKAINTDDDEMNSFLFRLGCYPGEPITLISKKKKSCIVVIKDSRYNLDHLLSEAIVL
jgi:ferrous iron transport protein A